MKNLLFWVIITLGFLIFQCSDTIVDNPVNDENGKSIKISMSITPQIANIAEKATFLITGTNMDTISVPLRISSSSIYGVVQYVPGGDNRTFEMFIVDSLGVLKFYGITTANINSSETTALNLILKNSDGTAVVTGMIKDNLHTNDYFTYTPSKPSIIFVTKATDTPPISIITFSTNSYGSEQIEYNWYLLKTDTLGHSVTVFGSDSSWDTESTFTHKFAFDGFYTIFVKAIGCFHPDFEKEISQQFSFTLSKNKIIIDIDTIYYTNLIKHIDTVHFKDSIKYIDTIYFKDSINYIEPIYFKDSINYSDTIYYKDSIDYINTIDYKDSINYLDTIYYNDSIDYYIDTIYYNYLDTIYYKKSINYIISTFYSNDSISYIDTVYHKDSINYIDTIYRKNSIDTIDTIYYKDSINYIDTTFYIDTINNIDSIFYEDLTQYGNSSPYGVSPSAQETQVAFKEIEPFSCRIRSFVISNLHGFMIQEFS